MYKVLYDGNSIQLTARNTDSPTVIPNGGAETDVQFNLPAEGPHQPAASMAPIGSAGCGYGVIMCRNAAAPATAAKLTFRVYSSVDASDATLWVNQATFVDKDPGEFAYYTYIDSAWPFYKVTAQETAGVDDGLAEIIMCAHN